MLIVTHRDVPRLLPMDECIEIMDETLRALAGGEAILPLRRTLTLPDRKGHLVMMPAYLGPRDIVGLKVITYCPGNRETPLDTHQGGVLLFDTKDGHPIALVDATEITSIRTAAVSAVATRVLARPEASRLAILGSGTQARTHLSAMLQVRPVAQTMVWSPSFESSSAFAELEGRRWGIQIQPARTAEEAVQGADLICTTTSATEPILMGEWLEAGVHMNAVGACLPHTRELDGEAVRRSKLFVDRRESAENESGDFRLACREGAISADHIRGEVGELLLGTIPGRTDPSDITLFKSLGLAIEDLAAAHHIYGKAKAEGVGQELDLGGARH